MVAANAPSPTDRGINGIQLDHVSKYFYRQLSRGRVESLRVLDDISFEINDGEFLSIVGPSGCGKTTLLRLVAGLARPDAGKIVIDGKEIRGPGPERAVVFQDFALLPWADVLSNVSFGLKLRGVPKRARQEHARRLIELVGLTGFEKSFPGQLSGGMRQRVGLARALAVEPKYLLMDEPFGSLDEISRRVMQEELLRIWERDKKTAVFITHSVEEAVFLSDRIVIMHAQPGRIADVLDVRLPRPRTRQLEDTPEFLEARDFVWKTLGV